MIRIEPDEEMDFMFRANAKIDGRKVGSGWLYVTDARVVFESDKHGICFDVPATSIDSQKKCWFGRFKFTWIENTEKGRWRFLFEGKIQPWDGWKPKPGFVTMVIRTASYGTTGKLGAGWRSDGLVYNEYMIMGVGVRKLTGHTPEHQRMYKRWRLNKAMREDGDFDFLHGKYDNAKELPRLLKTQLRGVKAKAGRCGREYKKAVKDGADADTIKYMYIRYIVHKRIVQIIKTEYKTYTFGSQTKQRGRELRRILTRMCNEGKSIAQATPPTKVVSAMIQARKDVDKFQERLKVRLPPIY